MSPHSGIIVAATGGAVVLAAVFLGAPAPPDPTELVTIAAGAFSYRAAGEYLRDGVPVNAPLLRIARDRPLVMMKHQVSGTEYAACVAAGACRTTAAAAGAGDRPVVEVSWDDAAAYAAWLSKTTGHVYRLPTDAEWAYAAGERFRDDALSADGDASDPSKRWLAAYNAESAGGDESDPEPRPFGAFGANRNGVADMAGNVWEWTATCYVRHASHAENAGTAADTLTENCGVRVVEGSHRAYMPDFIRRPRGGACSAGRPPDNLGIRLVRDDDESLIGRVLGFLRALVRA
jgi:formylglycine-generating enzyme required for sulfatase activity